MRKSDSKLNKEQPKNAISLQKTGLLMQMYEVVASLWRCKNQGTQKERYEESFAVQGHKDKEKENPKHTSKQIKHRQLKLLWVWPQNLDLLFGIKTS